MKMPWEATRTKVLLASMVHTQVESQGIVSSTEPLAALHGPHLWETFVCALTTRQVGKLLLWFPAHRISHGWHRAGVYHTVYLPWVLKPSKDHQLMSGCQLPPRLSSSTQILPRVLFSDPRWVPFTVFPWSYSSLIALALGKPNSQAKVLQILQASLPFSHSVKAHELHPSPWAPLH